MTCDKYPIILSKSKWYPYLIERKNQGYYIKGEAYKVSSRLLKLLDRVEEAPYYYYRKKICIKVNDKKYKARTYFVRKVPKYKKKNFCQIFRVLSKLIFLLC
ncbi:MAG: gamma-glutamylcyclotransferase family protein [Nautiliaceae bacterium]